jgi:hypothetical protein
MYLKAGLPKLGLKPECYSGLIDGTAERFAHQLSKRVIELGCDYLAKEIRKASTTKIKMIKTLAEDTCSWWRKKSPNHEHLNELKKNSVQLSMRRMLD